ncbi:MAG: site-specific integrase, partial [Candidatus Micrarchaeota archaeon]
PHLFRHSRATFYAALLPEALLKEQMGWTQSTKMAGVYVHLSGKRVDDAISEAYGQQKKAAKPSLDVKTCPRCGFANGFDAECCERCGTPLDQKAVVLAEADEEKFLATLFTTLVDDPEIKKKIGFLLNKSELGAKLLAMVKTRR